MPSYVNVSPDVLQWAIDRSGVPVEGYESNVAAWISLEKKPTVGQLEKFARKAMVPLGFLYLQRPPREQLPVPDYRTRSDATVPRPSPNLIETVFEMERRQGWMRDYRLELGEGELAFVASATVTTPVPELAARMRQTLGLEGNWAQSLATWEEAQRVLRGKIEAAGILIFASGVVGNNNHRPLNPEEFQGFVLVDDVAPVIFVNAKDAKSAQMFTIAHELAHVWLGQSALFELTATQATSNNEVEEYCNRVAAEFLVPAQEFGAAWPTFESELLRRIGAVSRHFKVSPIVAARRAKDLGYLSAADFFAFYRDYSDRERRQQDEQEGGNFWSTTHVRLGGVFGKAIVAAAKGGRLSYSDAYSFLHLKGSSFDGYVRRLASGDDAE